jgi:hypothetical protein
MTPAQVLAAIAQIKVSGTGHDLAHQLATNIHPALGSLLKEKPAQLDINAPVQVLVDGFYRELIGLGVNAKGELVVQVGDARRQMGRAL